MSVSSEATEYSRDTKAQIGEELLTYFGYGAFDYQLGEFGSIKECIAAHKSQA